MMKKVFIVFILFMVPATPARAQETHVETRYEKSIDRTIVRSDLLYVVNSPAQFMQIQLGGRYPGKGRPSQLPDRLYAEISSFAPAALYQPDAKHRLLVKAGDKVLDFGLLDYSKIQGKDSKQSDNPKAPKTNLAFSVTLPANAVIGTAHKKDELTVETMLIDELSLADLRMLADAADLTMKIGDTVFRFRPIHTEILREFARSITPDNVDSLTKAPARGPLPPDVPTKGKQTPLTDTLKWLKAHIERNGATNDVVAARRVEPISFDTCQIGYRKVPLVRTSQISPALINAIMEYQLDLADLNPEAVRVSDLGDYAVVFLTTRDYQPKIKLFKRANEGGTAGRTLEDALTESAIINFKTKAAAVRFKTALTHAIGLCAAQR